jgi:adenosylcobinamide-phosphate synthase
MLELEHYTLHDRLFLLILSQCAALLFGWRLLHQVTGYELPARAMRALFTNVEMRLNRLNRPVADRKARGRLVVWIGATLMLIVGGGVVMFATTTASGWYLELALLVYLIPLRAVILPHLEILRACKAKRFKDIPPLLQPLTDGDVQEMDGFGMIRHTVASLARIFPRRIVTPACWYLIGGMPALFVCRFIGAWAEMFPLTHPRFHSFALIAHRLDTMLQFIPTRFAMLLMWLGLCFTAGGSARKARIAWQNPTTVVLPVRMAAYGFGLSLGGAYYAGGVKRPDAWIGDGRAKLTSSDLSRALIWVGCSALLWLVVISSAYVF